MQGTYDKLWRRLSPWWQDRFISNLEWEVWGDIHSKNGSFLFRHYQATDVWKQRFLGFCIIHTCLLCTCAGCTGCTTHCGVSWSFNFLFFLNQFWGSYVSCSYTLSWLFPVIAYIPNFYSKPTNFGEDSGTPSDPLNMCYPVLHTE